MPEEILTVFRIASFLFGLLVGSFLNVCIYRLPNDLSVVRPRSHCPHCRRSIAWYDNFPVLSWLLLRGQCRHCFATIPWRYAAVELATGLAFLLSAIAFGPTVSAAKYAVFSALIIGLIVTDLQDRILPDEFTLGGTAAGLAFAPFVPTEPGILALIFWKTLSPHWIRLIDAAFASALFAGIMWLFPFVYQKLKHREGGWMGLGDVKMVALIGAFLGLRGSLITIFFGSLLGAVLGYVYIRLRKKDPNEFELPFGSFLGVAALAVAVWGEGFAAWYTRLGK